MNYYKRDTILISAPKAGRTWLRMILAKILRDSLKVNISKYELILATHYTPEKLTQWLKRDRTSGWPANVKILYMVRDPKDLVVSYFFEKPRFAKISEAMRSKEHGIWKFINHLNSWHNEIETFVDYRLISYEGMVEDTVGVIKGVLSFLDIKVPEEDIKEAVNYSSFDNMRNMERFGRGSKENLLLPYKGKFGEGKGTRVRKGEVGGYVKYFGSEDINYMHEACKNLDEAYAVYGGTKREIKHIEKGEGK